MKTFKSLFVASLFASVAILSIGCGNKPCGDSTSAQIIGAKGILSTELLPLVQKKDQEEIKKACKSFVSKNPDGCTYKELDNTEKNLDYSNDTTLALCKE